MIRRELKKNIIQKLKEYPALAILGPRQTGKTTLVKRFKGHYFDLELDSEQQKLDFYWDSIVEGTELIILDEAQNYPDIFPKIKYEIDNNRKRHGKFIILGSISPALMTNVSEFLTGRIALCELSPFSISEIDQRKIDNLWLFGGYPDGGIIHRTQFPFWQKNYLDLLCMRDLPHWGLPAKPQVIQRVFKMLAAVHGCIWNASQIGKSLGLSYHTVNSYLDYLEYSFLFRRVLPYTVNIRKRIQKSQKIYWRDSGLLHCLINCESIEKLLEHPSVGNSWEGFVINQILIFLNNHNILYNGPFYLMTSDGYEIDLILEFQNKSWAIEIKLSSQTNYHDVRKLNKMADMINADMRVLISRSKEQLINDTTIICDLSGFINYLQNRN